MKISLKWLNDFVDVTEFFENPNALADILTKAGLEVEEMTNAAKDFQNVVVGLVKVKDKHPNADKLSLCQVEVAEGKVEQIVCGAQNHKQGDKVIVALPGAVLPGNFAIKKSKIRDVESNGMLCSLKELGFTTVSDGIEILSPEAPIGMSYSEYSGHNDIQFELKVTPNRADCLSHFGLAREIGCLLNKEVKRPAVQTEFSKNLTVEKIKLNVQNSDLCPRYCGRYISGVKISDSPAWLKSRLESIGMNLINNVVDVTNYVMLEMGQPLHAFDADLISGAQITVRSANPGEKFKTLKEQDLNLNGDELLICDSEKAVALAGVIGGLNSGVNDETVNIFLESANFQAMSVRKSSRSHGIDTDSAYRFSRGVDPSQTQIIMDRAVHLILQVAGGTAFSGNHDLYPNPISKKPVSIQIQTISDRLGYAADAKLFEQYMKGLDCKVESVGDSSKSKNNEAKYSVTPPLFRFDLESDMDLVEEYARLRGYEHITETLPVFASEPTKHDSKYMNQLRLSEFLRSEGFSRAFNYAFANESAESLFLGGAENYEKWGLAVSAEPVRLKNPLSEEINIMRRSLSNLIWKNVSENFHAGNTSGSLFEIGSVFSKNGNKFSEHQRLCLTIWGEPFGVYSDQTPLVYKLKATIEKLFSFLQISAATFKDQAHPPSFLHTGQCTSLFVEGKTIGFIGTIHPQLLSTAKIRVPVAICEINLDLLIPEKERPLKFMSLSGFQAIDRDFSFVMDSAKPVGDLLKELKKAAATHFKGAVVFDIYEGDKLPAGQKSVAVRMALQSFDQALTEDVISQISQKAIANIEKAVDARLRTI
jgi:phenylalanyl-tRNA synthetase beta chain